MANTPSADLIRAASRVLDAHRGLDDALMSDPPGDDLDAQSAWNQNVYRPARQEWMEAVKAFADASGLDLHESSWLTDRGSIVSQARKTLT